jgi:defect in organelle trafficking protein DotB
MTEPRNPGIVLTPHALSRHAKRLRGLLAEHGVTLTATQSQEAFARVLGMKNWHEAHQRCQQGPALLSTPMAPASSSLAAAGSPMETWHRASAALGVYQEEPTDRLEAKDIEGLLRWTVDQGAHDIWWQTGSPVFAENHAGIARVTHRHCSKEDMQDVLVFLYGSPAVLAKLAAHQDVDFAYEIRPPHSRIYRFRVNATGIVDQNGEGVQITLRALPASVPSFKDLAMPQPLAHALSQVKEGLVMFSGQVGSGKTTSMAALVRDQVQSGGCRKVTTIEAPVEYTYETLANPSVTIAQSEVGKHVPSYAAGIRNALRRKPSVIVLGEARDQETLTLAMEACQTGHRLFTTINGASVAHTLVRVISAWPTDERRARMVDLIQSLQMVVSQRFVRTPGASGSRSLEWEWLVFDEATKAALMALPCEDEHPHDLEIWIKAHVTLVKG